MKYFALLTGLAIYAAAFGSASAEQWTDYSPTKGVWEVVTVKVDPNKIDDYLVGLKNNWVKGQDILKKEGVIDDYFVMVKTNASDGKGNVLLGQHFTSFAQFDPNKARDMEMMKKQEAAVSKEQGEKAVEGFDKYRTFVGDDFWTGIDFTK